MSSWGVFRSSDADCCPPLILPDSAECLIEWNKLYKATSDTPCKAVLANMFADS